MDCFICGAYESRLCMLPGNFTINICPDCSYTLDEILDNDGDYHSLFNEYCKRKDEYDIAYSQMKEEGYYDEEVLTKTRENYFAAELAVRVNVREILGEMRGLNEKSK